MSDKDVTEIEAIGFFLPPKSTVCTKTFWEFLSSYKETLDFFYFTLHLAHRADDVSLVAAKALIESASSDAEREKLQRTIDNAGQTARRLSKFSEVNSRNILTNIVDSFLWFISNTIQQAIKRKPEIIKSGETIKIEEIFNYPSRRDLINYLIDRKINSLSYGGLKQIEKYLSDALNIDLFKNEHDRDLLRIFIETRNIHTHNRGVVNRIFLERVGPVVGSFGFDLKEGTKVHFGYDALTEFSKSCIETALFLDQSTAKKFSIERKRISTWLK